MARNKKLPEAAAAVAESSAPPSCCAPAAAEGRCPECAAPSGSGEVIGCRHKKRSDEEKRALIIRLNRIEGQLRGIHKMVENDVYCPDILVQVAATSAALSGFSKELLSAHIRTCVTQDILEGKDESVDELLNVLQKLMK